MKVGLIWLNSWMGGVNYIRNISAALKRLPESKHIEIVLLPESKNEAYVEFLPEGLTKLSRRPNKTFLEKFQAKLIKKWRKFKRCSLMPEFVELATENQLDVVYPLNSIYIENFPQGIYWIPDFQFFYLPHLFSKESYQYQFFEFSKIIGNRNHTLVLSSQHALDCAREIYGEVKAQTHILRFRSIYEDNWFSLPKETLQKHNIESPYFIISNQFWEHKDHATAIKAFKLFITEFPDQLLVMTGELKDHRNPTYLAKIKFLIESLPKSTIRMIGLIERGEQMQLIRSSTALIQPSSYEGWSTVLEDARAVGARVIASDFPVHLEQDLPHCSYFPLGDAKKLKDRMVDCRKNLQFISVNKAKNTQDSLILDFAQKIFTLFKSQTVKNHNHNHNHK